MVNRELGLHFALRSDDGVEVGILGRRHRRPAGRRARMWRESCPSWLQEVLLLAERRLPMAVGTAHYTGRVVRSYRLGQPWLVVEGVSCECPRCRIDLAAEVLRFRP